MSSSSNHHKPPPSPPLPPPSPPPNVTTTLYHTHIGIFALTWSKTLFSRSLNLHLLPSTTTTSTNEEDDTTMTTTKTPSFHIQIKPFIFWNKTGSKKIHISNPNSSNNKQDYVTIYYDLSRAKFGPGPEPISGYYIAGIFAGQVTLLVGDSPKQALNKTKSNSPEKTQMTILRREHVAGICHKKYTTKATFRGKVHEIGIDCTRVSTGDDSRLCFSVDGKRVLVVKHLQWKFRGNERVEIDGVHIQVSWDVHNWLNDYDIENFNDDYDGGFALFMFRFEKSGFDYHEDDKYLARLNGSGIGSGSGSGIGSGSRSGFGSGFGFGFEMKKMKKGVLRRAKSSSSSSLSSASSGCGSVMEWESVEENELKGPTGFSLLVYAWKS